MSMCNALLYRLITTDSGRKLAEQWKAVFVEASAKQNEVCQYYTQVVRTRGGQINS